MCLRRGERFQAPAATQDRPLSRRCLLRSLLVSRISSRVGLCFGRSARSGKFDALGFAPETLEIVIFARPFTEDVHDEVAVIEQDPFGTLLTFAMRQMHSFTIQAFF